MQPQPLCEVPTSRHILILSSMRYLVPLVRIQIQDTGRAREYHHDQLTTDEAGLGYFSGVCVYSKYLQD